MQAKIGDSRPSAGLTGGGCEWRIGGHSGDPMSAHQGVGVDGEPRGVPGFADDGTIVFTAEPDEEPFGEPTLESEGGRQLQKDRAPLAPEAGDLSKETAQHCPDARQPPFVRDRAWAFDGKAESLRR